MPGKVLERRWIMGAALRRRRTVLGWGLADAARVLGTGKSAVSRIESGERGARPEQLAVLLEAYEVPAGEREFLLRLAAAREPGWWEGYADILAESFRRYLAIEAEAARVLAWDGQRVPPVLRTADYARAVAVFDPLVPVGAEGRVAEATGLRRQAVLASGARVTAVVGEAALRRRSLPARVMRAQLRVLADAAANGDAEVRVVPAGAGPHALSGSGPAVLASLPHVLSWGYVFADTLAGGLLLDSRQDVARYLVAFARLDDVALPARESAELLRRLAGG